MLAEIKMRDRYEELKKSFPSAVKLDNMQSFEKLLRTVLYPDFIALTIRHVE